jgi:hypothetical protein
MRHIAKSTGESRAFVAQNKLDMAVHKRQLSRSRAQRVAEPPKAFGANRAQDIPSAGDV